MRRFLLVAGLLFAAFTAIASASTAADPLLAGTASVEPTSDALHSGTAEAIKFTASASGTATQGNVYIDGYQNTATKVYVGLYTDASGKPGSLIASGSVAPTPDAWNAVTLKGSTITAGKSYWLAILGTGGQLGYRSSYGGCSTTRRGSLSSLPATFGGTSHTPECASVYVGGTTVSAAAVTPSNTGLPVVSGSTVQGQTLTTTNGSWNGSPTSYSYQWQDCTSSGCNNISGATGSSYKLQSSDVGDMIDAVVTAKNSAGSGSATSAKTATVSAAASAPSNTGLPQISGIAQQGSALTTSNGSWNGSPTSYAYKWEDCDTSGANCSAISGATSSSYTPTASDVGSTIRSVVTASNGAGSGSATSPAVGPVTAPSSSGGAGGVTPATGFQSVVFWLAWDGGTLSSLPWNAVTQVDLMSLATCVSAGNPEPDCTGPTSIDTQFNGVSNVSSFVNTVHQNGKLAIITIGGSTNPNWYYPCNGSNAAAFAQNLVNYMQSNGFDGVDLDIEQDTTTGSPAFSAADLQACAQDVYNDAKAIKTLAGNTPLVTSDVDPTTNYDIGQIEQPYVDQFNAMSYGATGSQLASQIQTLETQSGIPASKITEGVDIQDYPSTQADCGSNASWAASNGLAGAMLWFGQWDAPSYPCLNAVAPYVK